ncbi:porin family protein [Sediminicola luteus]|uniref:Uncharacterized protein n=1 Tax=Sediminicola luteus TaxID=319238 RepID=A0A2A4G321_9FLAO|nr:outer membrane beta-barrel protein [Sediminicola luteus]PCE63369.1 hypothetical protein B7P33_14215 [Sediminicola luteus]
MKKMILPGFLSYFLCVFMAYAQSEPNSFYVNKGTWELSGNMALSFADSYTDSGQSDNDLNSFGLSLMPELGYAIADQLTLGAGIGFVYNTSKNNNGISKQEDNYRSLRFAPFVKKYIRVAKPLYFTLKGSASYETGKQEHFDNGQKNGENNFDNCAVGVSPGVSVFLNDRFAFQSQIGFLGYRHHKTEAPNGGKSRVDRFSLDFNTTQFFFGLAYYF